MNPDTHSLALLRKANPASLEPLAAQSPQARAALERIIGEPRVSQGARARRPGNMRLPGPLRLPARLAVGSAGVAAVATAVIVALLSGSAAAPAFAGWTTRPSVAPQHQLAAATRRCGLARPALTEARGPYTASVFASRSGGTACVVGPSLSFVASVGGAQGPDNRFKPDQVGVVDLSGSDHEGHGFILLTGRVGSAVRSIVIRRRDHPGVVASIKDGWYLAWWPASTHATGATVTTTGGRYNMALPAAAKVGASCSGFMRNHPSGACASVGPGSNGPGSDGVPGPPLVGQPLARPFEGALLFNVWNASAVLVCFHPPANLTAVLQPNGPTGPCTHATLLTRLPPRYPVQRNLLEVFPKGVWEISLPTGARGHGTVRFLVIARGTSRFPPARNELTVSW